MKTKFFLLLCLTALLFVALGTQRDYWSTAPYQTEAAYSNISRVATDAQGSLYTIANSKRSLIKVNPEGELVYSVSSNADALPGTIQLFDGIATDEQGYAYVLLAILDSYGLKVSGERILKVSPDGETQQVLYEADYAASENLLRVGKIQGLSVKEGAVHFFRKEVDTVVLFRLAAGGGAPDELRTFALPANRYVSELTGSDPNGFYFTSKRGRLYAVDATESPTMLYPGEGTVQLNFPVQVFTNDGRHVYFIDYHEAAVQRLDAGQPHYPIQSLLRYTQLTEQFGDVEWSDFTNLYVGHGKITVATTDQIIEVDPTGRIAHWTSTYRYPTATIWLRYAYWALILAAAASFFATIRHLYVRLMKRRISLLVKQLGVIVPIILAAMVGLSYSVYDSFTNEMKEEMRGQLMLLAGNGKHLVDGERLERLNSPLDFMSEHYQAIKLRMNDLLSQAGENRDGLYSTVYRYIDGNLYIIMDDDDSVTMFRPFLTSEENLLVLKEGRIVSGEWEDATGEWMYALGPLYNASGDIIGIYETGKDMNGVRQSHLKILSDVLGMIALIGGVILIVITVMTVYLISSIRRLRRSVNLIASGEWDTEVDIRTRDEVAELGERFNMMAGSIRRYIREVTGLSESYFRFVPQQFLNVLGKGNMTQVRLGDQVHRTMTVLVCNMRDFSEFSSTLTPEDNFRFINSFLKVFGPVVRQHGGFTSRYLGPGMLALFPNDPGDALKAAVKMRETLATYNGFRDNSGYRAIEIGISIHIGDVMIGIIGEEQRMEGSVVSDQVRLAGELEKASGKLGAPILLTEEALAACKRTVRLEYRKLGAVQLYGEARTIELYDVYEGDPEPVRKLKRETQRQFEDAVMLYQGGRFYDAREAFVGVVKKNRDDLAAKLYFFACDHYYQHGVTQDWNGALKIE
ncbi:HAMP domain-containing protein [Paenibacillus sp.]|uniref:HAMP domain-containing protein n=1 Tax=Paenibacillus sp. TaxID=58172 RepID=UPI00281234C2|nr:HAMP domain-containing protein [Paenibacillus sp.]